MNNPYGAVPEALKDTRLTLRDIAADILMTKKQEAELSLAKSKAETETAMVNSGIVRDQMHNDLQMSSLKEASRHNIAGEANDATRTGIEQQNVGINQQRADTDTMVGKSTVNLHNAQAAGLAAQIRKAQREERRLNTPMTAEQYSAYKGLPGAHQAFGFQGNETRTLGDWEESAGKPISNILNNFPGLQLDLNVSRLTKRLTNDIAEYHALPPGPDKDKKLKQLNESQTSIQLGNDMLSNVKINPAEIAKIATKNWSEDYKLQEEYKDKGGQDAYVKDFGETIRKISARRSEDVIPAKFYLQYGITPTKAENQIDTYKKIIQQSADPRAKGTLAEIEKLVIKNKDLYGAYEYAKYAADQIAGQTKTPSLRSAAKSVKNVPTAADDYSLMGM